MLSMARRRAGFTQRELSRRTGVPQPSISRIERGLVSPSVDTLDKLVRACGMELEAIEREGVGVDRGQIVDLLRQSPAARLRHVARGAEVLKRFKEAKEVG